MGDPIGAAAHVRQSLTNDGTWMIVEPFANDQTISAQWDECTTRF